MKKLLLLATLVFGMNAFAQTKQEQFAIDNGLEITVRTDNYVVAKKIMRESLTVLLVNTIYTFEAVFTIEENKIRLTQLENTSTSNGANTIDVNQHRGMMKEVITKKQWEKLVGSVNNQVEALLSKYNK